MATATNNMAAPHIHVDGRDADDLVVTVHAAKGRPSQTGKTTVFATTGGPVRVLWNGRWLKLNLSLYSGSPREKGAV